MTELQAAQLIDLATDRNATLTQLADIGYLTMAGVLILLGGLLFCFVISRLKQRDL